ncbi:LamG-like jellyroll fold domain-containing protein [Microbacterium sp. M3]|uniref:LamG-like jellyroll fold domain-containing protein n=1 Tax=Microbacterium arthrosphaerae TaxID=792652 RepID=A0ABU4GWB6_9MICO|nr:MULTISPECIES: LamG-like jellyroll fold domain-containing protein [Microbacterium]MDW4571361.1 LamG-like jellyroll fold domain-containing protein [Microbacterium arthrosphaerae]MDW7605216.1 LamG-like jellyroll fold domain-containing protein [Microbacterium sp. M3]
MTRRAPHRTALALTTAGLLVAGTLSAAPAWAKPPADPPAPVFTDVTVHDPSIVTSGDDIWAFGSHGASARTTDLMSWQQHTVDLSQNADNALFDDIYTELAETFEWAQTSTLWAADVIQLPDGRYAMYYNACEGSSPRSALGLATSDAVDGPYENQGILLKSGMWDEESENPGEVYDARVHPNAVDPDAFVDADGRMWMVYGSYSGGIFLLEMDAATGQPLPGQGYGTHLVGGNHSRIEAPTIQYDAATGYYYLYLSFGGLGVTGGYDVRVARSKDVAGPYLDAQGNDMREVKSDPALPLFDDASIQPYGVKLMGGHLFGRELGDPGTGAGTGYVSPGHTSWYQDPATGRMFMVFHARFPGTGELHEVRVHQMWMNADGWPVVSPMRYAGETAGKVKRADVVGSWQLVDLGKDITATAAEASDVTLGKTGRVSGAVDGEWKLTGQHTATITIDGVAYRGVFAPVWDPDLEAWSTGFTAVSDAGVTLWARKSVEVTDAAAVAAVIADLSLGDTSGVTVDLDLPASGTGGTTIAWATSDASVIAADGTVTRPGIGEPDAHVTLTATVANGAASASATFEVTVLARTPGVLAGAWSFDGSLSDDAGAFADATLTGARIDAPATAPAAFVADGVEGTALHLDGTGGVRLPDGLVQGSSYSVSLWLRPEALTAYTTAFFAAATPTSWVSLVPRGHDGVGGSTMLWSGTQWYDAGTGRSLPLGEWSHVAFVVDGGAASVYVDGELRYQGTGFPDVLSGAGNVFALGVNWWDVPFRGDVDELSAWSSALSPDDVAELATR